jgi:hypothetical protein
MNLNDLAKKIALKEGGSVNLNIAEIKEVMRLVFVELSGLTDEEVFEIVNRYR